MPNSLPHLQYFLKFLVKISQIFQIGIVKITVFILFFCHRRMNVIALTFENCIIARQKVDSCYWVALNNF